MQLNIVSNTENNFFLERLLKTITIKILLVILSNSLRVLLNLVILTGLGFSPAYVSHTPILNTNVNSS